MSRSTILYINFASLLATIAVNYSMNTGIINGNTVRTISDRYHNMFTPAQYAFGIWGVIYLLLTLHFIYCFYHLRSNNKKAEIIEKTGLLFAGTSLVNCLWIYFWLQDYIGICIVLMFVLLLLLTKILTQLNPAKQQTTLKQLLTTTPFTLYGGWVCVALIANVSAFLTKEGWLEGFANEAILTMVLIIAAGLINIFLSWKYKAIAFGLAGVWGITAVALNNLDKNFEVSIVGILTATAILSTCLFIGTRKLSTSTVAHI